jgi:hypothetical protein
VGVGRSEKRKEKGDRQDTTFTVPAEAPRKAGGTFAIAHPNEAGRGEQHRRQEVMGMVGDQESQEELICEKAALAAFPRKDVSLGLPWLHRPVCRQPLKHKLQNDGVAGVA